MLSPTIIVGVPIVGVSGTAEIVGFCDEEPPDGLLLEEDGVELICCCNACAPALLPLLLVLLLDEPCLDGEDCVGGVGVFCAFLLILLLLLLVDGLLGVVLLLFPFPPVKLEKPSETAFPISEKRFPIALAISGQPP